MFRLSPVGALILEDLYLIPRLRKDGLKLLVAGEQPLYQVVAIREPWVAAALRIGTRLGDVEYRSRPARTQMLGARSVSLEAPPRLRPLR